MTTTVLVTGAKGQLAKTIEELYADNQDNIDFIFAKKKDLDITNSDELNKFFANNNFDYCINCAAYTNVEQAEKTPQFAFDVNAEGVKNLATVCYKVNCVLIHMSTDYVFDGEKKEPYTIDDVPNPINEYGKSKHLGEQYIQETLEHYFIIRTSWLYSKKFGHNFYRTIVNKAKTETKLFITDKQIGCPTDTVSLSKYIFSIITKKSNSYGLKHFCDTKIMTWYDFAKLILEENNISSQVTLVKATKYLTFARRPKSSILLNTK